MICLISFLNRFFLVIAVCLSLSVLAACATDTTALKQQTLPEQFGPGPLRIAVLPFENMSGKAAPLKPLKQSAVNRLKALGFSILDDTALDRFMTAHRLRYTGGVDAQTAQQFKSELGVDAVLITNIELYDDAAPPKIALLSRLVSTGEPPSILWMNGVSLAGDESPGILGVGLIEDPSKLTEKALGSLFGSMMDHSSGKTGTMNIGRWGYGPRAVFASPVLQRGKRYTIAIVPFTNKSARRNAGDLVELHFAEQLVRRGDFEVVEPGIVRQNLLNLRLVMPEGISLSDIDVLFDLLNTDLVLIGTVFEYQDQQQGRTGTPKVGFSTFLIDRASRRIIWSSGSHNGGDDYIYAFDWGKVYTAHELMSRMAAKIVRILHEKLYSEPKGMLTGTLPKS